MLGEVVVVVLPRPRGWVDDAAAADAMVIRPYWYWSNNNKFDGEFSEFNTVQRQTDELNKICLSAFTGIGMQPWVCVGQNITRRPPATNLRQPWPWP